MSIKSAVADILRAHPRRESDITAEAPQGTAINRKTYTIDEVSVLLGLSRNSTYVNARAGLLPVPVIKIGKRMLVSRAALDRFLEAT